MAILDKLPSKFKRIQYSKYKDTRTQNHKRKIYSAVHQKLLSLDNLGGKTKKLYLVWMQYLVTSKSLRRTITAQALMKSFAKKTAISVDLQAIELKCVFVDLVAISERGKAF